MATPRLTASVRKRTGKTPMKAHAKFPIGALLYNRNTKVDGVVRRVYQVGGFSM
jgi:hypothetical protein